jgi:hypothetical protein
MTNKKKVTECVGRVFELLNQNNTYIHSWSECTLSEPENSSGDGVYDVKINIFLEQLGPNHWRLKDGEATRISSAFLPAGYYRVIFNDHEWLVNAKTGEYHLVEWDSVNGHHCAGVPFDVS